MLPHYECVYEPKRNIKEFGSARQILMEEDGRMNVKRRFERIYNVMGCKSYIKKEDILENKQIFNYAFKHVRTDKVDNYILIGFESQEFYENDKLFNFWPENFVNKAIEMRNFKIAGWLFMTLVKRKSFFKNHGICLCLKIIKKQTIFISTISI